ncbi:hypothetical protein DSM106972_049070 [Dulcicalothrix desertica PCC 7102]|uniref:Calx-beta domain-containing protein n=1 Tax=Dulcicalothrix desertica PCC 7102 TaxID=232991 RepID=A0A3S1ALM6_9CYAN|nr:FG-GAP-like repeat-containing protein [Dulcicalothrix desertica]RUT03993.1 hypothetical protein DSM106972_049070 [Dulcicalothrix desertica PCC 7102]TWH43601.1 hemolysin type calcium-binding protein [Dulcicalothrix desertica PCC 7102]
MNKIRLIGADILDESTQFALNEATLILQNYLSESIKDGSLLETVNLSFGNQIDASKLENLLGQWATGNFKELPTIEIRPAAEMNGANGAFAKATNNIYLSWEYITQNTSYPQAITNVLLEEIGHFVDAQINALDSPGDEGAIFSALVRGETLDEGRLQQLKAENDTATITLDGQVIEIEQADNEVTISGTILWTDSAIPSKTHPVREATVKIWDEDLGLDTLIATVYTDSQGRYSASFDNNEPFGQGKRDIYIEVLADGLAHHVDGVVGLNATTYSQTTNTTNEIPDGANTINFTIGNGTDAERAFSISDALYVGKVYADTVRGKLPTPRLKARFPDTNTAYTKSTNKDLLIRSGDSLDWDVILHEYGHFLADIDNLADSPGGKHIAGYSSITGEPTIPIPASGKSKGIRIAWGEGLATYLGIAAQYVAADAGLLPNVPNVGDPIYTDTIDQTAKHDLENKPSPSNANNANNPGNKGEGDEASVFRILWDLADGKNEPHDGIEIEIALLSGHKVSGHEGLYYILNNEISDLDQLDDVWDYFYGISTDAERTKFGAIFEEYGVSPEPNKSKLIGKTFKVNESDPNKIPQFTWNVNNNDANDDFQVIIFNEDFSRRVVDTKDNINPENINTNTWTPTLEQWTRVTNNQGKYNFIVAGSDTIPDPKSGVDPNFLSTGSYWSGAYTFSVGPSIGLQPLKNGLGQILSAIQTALTEKIFGATGLQNISSLNGIPLLGDTLKTATGALFIKDLSIQIEKKFTDKLKVAENASVDEIQEAFFELFGPSGLFGATGLLKDSNDAGDDITQEDIIYTRDGSLVKFNFKLGGTNKLETSLPSKIGFGLPQLGLELGENAKAGVDLDYTFDFGFGIETATNEFFFDTSPNKDLSISLKPSLPKAKATLGFLQVDAKDIGSQLDFSLNLEDGNDNQLTIGELNNNSFTVSPEGSADIKLNLLSSINGLKGLPQLSADLIVNWDFVQNVAPTVAFKDVELDLGSFLSDFAGPVLEDVNKITKPIKPVIDILTKKIDLKVIELNLLDIGKKLGYIDQSDINFINSVDSIIKIVDGISKFSNSSDTKINLGSFNLGDEADIRKPDFLLSNVDNLNIISTAPSASDQINNLGNVNEKQIINSLITIPGEGLKFPLLTEPMQAFKLLLGKDIPLFTYDLPQLKFDFGYTQFFPIVGPFGVRIGGNIGGEVDLAFGYDTKGLRDFSKSGDATDIFNGIYVSDRANADGTGDDIAEVKFNVGLEASAELNVKVVSAGVGGGIYGNVDFNLNDPNKDGKVYFDEVKALIQHDPLCLFDASGKVTAGLNAYFTIGVRPFQIRKRYDSPRRTLAEFNSKCDDIHNGGNGGTQNVPILATDIGSGALRLNMGLNAAARVYGNIIDDAEIFTIEHKSGSIGSEKVLIAAFDTSKEYNVASKIVANGGEKNDIIQLKDNVLTSAELAGGNGDDLIMSGNGNDSLDGNSGFDLLDGGLGNDTLRGGDNDDWLVGGAGADVLDGGADNDTASYETATTGISLNLATLEATGDAQGDVFVSIEQYEGSPYDDTLIGDATNNILGGLGGNDLLSGGDGNDFLEGGDGNDTLHGDAGDDFLVGGAGADSLYGGSGIDKISYSTATEGISLNLATGEATGEAQGDKFVSIEQYEGSPYNDTLIGTDADEVLIGGGGADILQGGLGNDTYELDAQTIIEGLARAAGSRIQDTNGANDILNLSNITLSLSGLASGQAGLARLGSTLLIDINKDGVANQADDLSIDNFFSPRNFSINEVTITEGNNGATNALFTIKGLAGTAGAGFIETVANLSGTDILNFLSTVTINYATADGTATATTDYNPTSGQLTFAQNETEKIISVQVIGDTNVESDETFFVNLNTDNNTDITGFQTVGTILNDDLPSINVSFSNAPNSPFSVGLDPRSIALGDFNKDGNQDLAVANNQSDNISILLGDGKGSFGTAANFGAGDAPLSVAVGDFNADGNQDLAVANYGSPATSFRSNISVLLGDGTGRFGTPTNFNAGSSSFFVTVQDLNADRLSDLIVVNLGSDNISVLLGNGTGSFGNPTNFYVGDSPRSVAVKDLNADGFLDLTVANFDSANVSVLLGNGTGSFGNITNFNTGGKPTSVAVEDLNADGIPDLAVANYSSSSDISVLLGDGFGNFGTATNYNIGAASTFVTIKDLNADGIKDLIAPNYFYNKVSMLFGDGTGSFGTATNFDAAGDEPRFVVVEDFNKDGKQDLAMPHWFSNNVSVLLNTTVNAPIGADSGATLNGSSSINRNMILGNDSDDILARGKTSNIITVGAGSNQSLLPKLA